MSNYTKIVQSEAEVRSPEQAEEGMAEMSRAYNEGGRELYVGAGGREHD